MIRMTRGSPGASRPHTIIDDCRVWNEPYIVSSLCTFVLYFVGFRVPLPPNFTLIRVCIHTAEAELLEASVGEQRRFEILEAHWDLAVAQIALDRK